MRCGGSVAAAAPRCFLSTLRQGGANVGVVRSTGVLECESLGCSAVDLLPNRVAREWAVGRRKVGLTLPVAIVRLAAWRADALARAPPGGPIRRPPFAAFYCCRRWSTSANAPVPWTGGDVGSIDGIDESLVAPFVVVSRGAGIVGSSRCSACGHAVASRGDRVDRSQSSHATQQIAPPKRRDNVLQPSFTR